MKFLPLEQEYSNYQVFGFDEAGRGPLAGPLSLSILHFHLKDLHLIQSAEILPELNDSKKLSEKKRDLLFSQIPHFSSSFQIFISPKSIDKFGLSFCIFRGILSLLKKSGAQNPFLLIDGNYKFEKYFHDTSFPYRSIIQGDSKVASIAGASIIAKVKRDRYMKELSLKYPDYEFEKHKGYGTERHRNKIKELGPTKHHRMTFLNETPLFPNLSLY